MSTRSVKMGGLMRCCMLSIGEYNGPEVPGETVIGCKYHKHPEQPAVRIDKDGWWEWAREEERQWAITHPE